MIHILQQLIEQITMSNIKMFPLTVLDKCINHPIWIVMKGKREFAGTLLGFDDFFNIVLEDVTEIWIEGDEKKSREAESILLNGHDIAYMVPGDNPLKKKEVEKEKKVEKNPAKSEKNSKA